MTESSQNGILLIQLFSGCFFRDMCVKRDRNAARKYFYRIARDHSLGLDSAAALVRHSYFISRSHQNLKRTCYLTTVSFYLY